MREEIPSGAKTDQFGSNPHGFSTYDADGRMMALITRRERTAPAGARATAEGRVTASRRRRSAR